MATLEEVDHKIKAIAASITEAKASGTAKTDPANLKKLVDELLAAKEVFAGLNGGVPYDPPKAAKKAKGPAKTAAPERAPGEKSKKEQQKELKKAQKVAAKAANKGGGGGGGGAAAAVAPPAVAAAAAASPGSASGPRALPSGPSKATTAPHPPAAPKGTTAGPREGAVNFCAAMPPVVAYAACSLTGTKLVFAVGEEAIPCLRLPDGRSISGDLAIARYVARCAATGATGATGGGGHALLGGSDPVEVAVGDQWLDLSLTRDLAELEGTLDAHLAPRTYLAGHELSLADVAVYAGLSRTRYTPPKAFANLCRWFSMISGVKAVSSAKGAIMALSKSAAAAASPGSASGPRALPSGPSKATTAPHPPAAPKGTTAGPRGGAVNFCAAMPPVVAYAACSLTGTKLVFAVGEEAIPCLRLPDGRSISGDLAIARYVARCAATGATGATGGDGHALLGGSDSVEVAVGDQWLDLSLTRDLAELEGTLDAHLAPRTYLAGHELSLADVAVYAGLSRTRYTPPKAFANLCRWFSMVSGVKAVSSAKGAIMALSKSGGGGGGGPGNKGKSSSSRGLPSGGKPAKKLAQGCPPLEGAIEGQVVTRFPPEPSGYLHIGHVKACLLNQYYAQHYGGKMIVRFDDTNPSKEKEEYAASIVQDLATLGIRADLVTYTSDRFEEFKEYALVMIKSGDAYMDDTPQDAMQEERRAFKPSTKRDTPIKENLRLFDLLLKGDKATEAFCLRAKADYASVNGTMRDPVMYRMNYTPHHRTGTKHKAYPTYDFACPIIDSVEGVTHACRTTEYLDRDEQYAWFQEKLGLRKVVVHSYARMNFMRTVLSKRHLGWFVEEGRVEGWDDPRFPTVQGVIRRGVSPAALRDFMLQQGASKKVTNMEWDKFWSMNKKKYEQGAHRYMGVFKDTCVELHIENAPEGDVVSIPVALHPKHPEIGKRAMRLAPVVLLEGGDADAVTEGEEVTLKNWGNVKVSKVEKDAAGKATRLSGRFIPNGDFKTTKKVTWLAKVPDLVPMVLVEFDYLVTKDKIEEGENFKDFLNPRTRADTEALGDPGLRNMKEGDVVQLERRGFFRADKPYRGEGKPLVLFMIPDGKTQAMSTLVSTLKHV